MIALILAALAPLQAVAPPPPPPAPTDAAPGDWRPIPDDELVVMTLAGDRTVVIRLAPGYAPEHVANVRRLALAHYWDGTSVYRVQDNWVTQWGGQPDDPPNDGANKALPAGVVKAPAAEYEWAPYHDRGLKLAQVMKRSDAYSTRSGLTADGWPVASDDQASWLTHCYGTVGVARDASPDTGSGSELFMPIGGSARRLDRNYTIVGRVIEGARYLSGLPRSGTPMGVYTTLAERTAIVSVRLSSELPPTARPRFEYRATDNPRFAAYLEARLHPRNMVASGGLDVCDAPLPTRRVPAG